MRPFERLPAGVGLSHDERTVVRGPVPLGGDREVVHSLGQTAEIEVHSQIGMEAANISGFHSMARSRSISVCCSTTNDISTIGVTGRTTGIGASCLCSR